MKSTLASIAALSTVLAIAGPTPAAAQDRQLVPVKVDLVVSRTGGEKKVSSLHYTLWVTANQQGNRAESSLRLGVQVPIMNTASSSQKGEAAPPSYSYRNVGTNIDCLANTIADGRFSVTITLNESGIQYESKESARAMPGLPAFRDFTSRFTLLLRDGQTATYTSATDPVSGETLKVDVTLAVLK